jgi:hypothetical protein
MDVATCYVKERAAVFGVSESHRAPLRFLQGTREPRRMRLLLSWAFWSATLSTMADPSGLLESPMEVRVFMRRMNLQN